MKKENSIKLLQDQKSKLQEKSLDERHWTDETANFVSNIFGKDSEQFKQIRDINISINDYVFAGGESNPMKNRIRAEKYLDSFITLVENFTYEKSSTFNTSEEFKFNKSAVYTIIPIVISGAFILGFYFGNTKFDKDKIELTEKVKSLSAKTDSLDLQLKLKDKIILRKEIKNKEITDSLRGTQKDLNSLYLYLGSLEKDNPK